MPTVLVVDDDQHIREVVQYALEREGFTVQMAADGKEGLARAEGGGIDLVILDILMPEMDGLEVCRRLRAAGELPIIFLSSKGEEVDRIVGLELGGDDYLAKPFSPRELVARVKAVLRRQRGHSGADAVEERSLNLGPVAMDPTRHCVTCHGEDVPLTVTEFAVLQALLRRPGQVMTRQVIVSQVYSPEHHMTERTIDTHIRRIRAKFNKLGFDPIETVFGLGYKAREP